MLQVILKKKLLEDIMKVNKKGTNKERQAQMIKTEREIVYPKEVQEAIKMARKMTREDIIKHFDEQIQYYKDYNANNPTMSWAKDYPRLYAEEKQKVLDEFDKYGMACWHKDYNHYGYGFDCEDIDVYLYTDGTYKVSHHSYSAY